MTQVGPLSARPQPLQKYIFMGEKKAKTADEAGLRDGNLTGTEKVKIHAKSKKIRREIFLFSSSKTLKITP
jgi:hypothetical protein